ncbi:MAG: arsenite efflux transporter metallochaperone ArsD [Acidimicrobiales bacterium]
MSTIEVFDPPMCCSTGVCGPRVDPALATFASDLDVLSNQGVTVTRHNLSQEPKAFAEDPAVRELLHERGDEVLPVIWVNGQLRATGRYPTRRELEAWVHGEATESLDAVTSELVAIGAAIGANCESCLTFHYNEARRLGVSSAVLSAAVRVAHTVKDAPAASIAALAAQLLGSASEDLSASASATQPSGTPVEDASCCSPASSGSSSESSDAPRCGGETSELLTIGAKSQGSACCG